MLDLEEKNTSDFVIEKIKERPINKKKLLRRTLITASMAVMFGLIACFTFLIIEPVISNWLYPQEEKPNVVDFPEDEEEMVPGEMLSDNKSEEKTNQGLSSISIDKKKREEVFAAMEYYEWDVNDYAKMYDTLGEFARSLQEYVVTVTAREENQDWMDSTNSKKTKTSGVVIGNNGRDLLILTSYSSIKAADGLTVTFFDGYKQEAQLLQKHTSSDIAIVTVSIAAMGERINQVRIAPLGYGSAEGYLTTPVIALGKTMEEIDVIQYGNIISHGNESSLVDANFELLMTDIYGTLGGNGFLFNLKGQVIGMVPSKKPSTEVRNMVMAYEIGDIKRLISRLSNGYEIPYAGIIGTMVSEEAQREGNVPNGIYIKNVAMNSPAMMAGIQPGDVIVSVNDKEIEDFRDYFNTLAAQENGSAIKLKVMRLAVNEYRELEFNIVVSQSQ